LDKKGKPTSMIISNYKSGAKERWARAHRDDGSYIVKPFPSRLGNILEDYINDAGLVSGDYLFGVPNNPKKPLSEGVFSSSVTNILRMSVNALRHSYVSSVLDSMKTTRQKESLAWQMGTSANELQKTYYKVNELQKTYYKVQLS
jgi:hypothetical protein